MAVVERETHTYLSWLKKSIVIEDFIKDCSTLLTVVICSDYLLFIHHK